MDFISDRQLENLEFENDAFKVGSARYRAIVVPQCKTMPMESLIRIGSFAALKAPGAAVVFEGDIPESTLGLADRDVAADERQKAYNASRKLLAQTNLTLAAQNAIESLAGRTSTALAKAGIHGERFVRENGLEFVRRRFDDGVAYFIVNARNEPYDGWTTLRAEASSVALFDPLTGDTGLAEIRPADDKTKVRLRLAPRQTIIVRTYDRAVDAAPLTMARAADPGQPAVEAIQLSGPWNVSFVDGGPTLPAEVTTDQLKSWTDFGGDDVKNFSGVGRYTLAFDAPEGNVDAWVLDLGEVHESADVQLNGESLATLFCKPFQVRIPAVKLREHNTLEIDVANLMANRIADLDRRGVAWQKFYNVNMAARRRENAGPRGVFSAAKWTPLPSGLLGPVTLTPAATSTKADGVPTSWKFDYEVGKEPTAVSIEVPEGNYRVTATLGGGEESTTTIHAEVRRLLAERVRVPAGETATFTATVAVRTPRIADGREVRLKDRERTDEWANWDDKLTLTFSGGAPAVRSLVVERDDRCPTLFLLGDSTVADQAKPPWNSWGQMLPRFFGPTIAVANHAESGESLRSALGERRVEKVYRLLKPGDWVAVQFGHNDMKSTAPDALDRYAADLEELVAGVRQRGATPILITSMERKHGIEGDTLAGYPDAVRRVAAESGAPLVDLHAMSRTLYRALGDNLDAAFQDATHHQDFGSYELARCVVEGLRTAVPELAAHLAEDAGHFDPAHPDSPEAWGAPTDPQVHASRSK